MSERQQHTRSAAAALTIMAVAVALLVGTVVVGTSFLLVPQSRDPKIPISDVSFVQLVATPELYDGKRVRVAGWFTQGEQESNALYLSHDDMILLNFTNGLLLEFHSDVNIPAQTFNDLDRKFVSVEGIFHLKRNEHHKSWPAGLHEVDRIDESPRKRSASGSLSQDQRTSSSN